MLKSRASKINSLQFGLLESPYSIKQVVERQVKYTYQLIRKHQHSLQRQLAVAVIEEVFQARSKKVDNHDIVVTLNSKPL